MDGMSEMFRKRAHKWISTVDHHANAMPIAFKSFVLETSSMTDTAHQQEDTYSAEQTKARADAALKRMLTMPPKLHKDSKLGRRGESQLK